MSRAVDVAIVGAGPAGLVGAIACARIGLETCVIERREPPIDKACGEGLMPNAVAVLQRLDVPISGLGAHFSGIEWIEGDRRIAASFREGTHGLGVRRTALHRRLVQAAVDAGVDVSWGVEVDQLEDSVSPRLSTSAGTVESKWLVAADGLHSSIRKDLSLQQRPRGPRRLGVRRHFRCGPWSERVEVHWRDGAEAYVTPVGDEEVGVAVLFRADADSSLPSGPSSRGAVATSRFDQLLDGFPALRERLDGCEVTSRDRGSGSLEQPCSRSTVDSVALLGDAGGYVDAITGEGMAIAFEEALALQSSLRAGSLDHYSRWSRRLRRMPNLFVRATLLLARSPRLRRFTLASLDRAPSVFGRLVDVHATGRLGERSAQSRR